MSGIVVNAEWDHQAEVWTAMSADVPGLVAEADSIEKLRPKILAMIGDLIKEGVVTFDLTEIPVNIVATSRDRLNINAAA